MSEERYHITYAEKRHPDAPDEYIIASDAQLTMYDHAEELHMACEHAIAMMEDVPGAKDFFSVWAELRSIIYRCQGQTPPDSDIDAFLMMFGYDPKAVVERTLKTVADALSNANAPKREAA